MLKIAELKQAVKAAEAYLDNAVDAQFDVAKEALERAEAAYYAEYDVAQSLKKEYEAMGDDEMSGVTNAGDTITDENRFISTEYWKLAIDSFLNK